MAKGTAAKIANESKVRFGALALVLSLLGFVGSLACFISDAELMKGLDLGPDAGTFGWYALGLSMLMASVALVCGVLIKPARSGVE